MIHTYISSISKYYYGFKLAERILKFVDFVVILQLHLVSSLARTVTNCIVKVKLVILVKVFLISLLNDFAGVTDPAALMERH